MGRRVKVVQVMHKETGQCEIDIDADNDDDCGREHKVLEAMQLLFGVKSDEVEEISGGPGQVEAQQTRKRVKN